MNWFVEQTLKAFDKRVRRFCSLFPQYRRFAQTTEYIETILVPHQREMLVWECGGEVISFATQLLLAFEYRYNDWNLHPKELEIRAKETIDKYQFLFHSDLSPHQIRTILLRELMEVISIGSQCFKCRKLFRKFRYQWYVYVHHRWDCTLPFTRYRLAANELKRRLFDKYKNLPPRIEVSGGGKEFQIPFFWEFLGPGYCLFFKDQEIKAQWINETLKKLKWFFEYLNSRKWDYPDKYREKIYEEMNFCLKRDANFWCENMKCFRLCCEKSFLPFLNVSDIGIRSAKTHFNSRLPQIVDEILSHFDRIEQNMLSDVDSLGRKWPFRQQLLDRYHSKYPSIVSLEEINQHLRKKIMQYKPLLMDHQNFEEAKEIMLDELEGDLFISRPTHIWNKEMVSNLSTPQYPVLSSSVNWAINQIVHSVRFGKISIKGNKFDLRALLTARWRRAWLAQGEQSFKRRLMYALMNIEWKEKLTTIDLQRLLAEMDFCFLYPKKRRIKRDFLWKDGTDDWSKTVKNIRDRSPWFARLIGGIGISIFVIFLLIVG